MARGERTTIRSKVAEILEAGLSIPFLDYSPDDAEVVFGNLPSGIVDWDPTRTDRWVYADQPVTRYSHLLVEIYEPITEQDEDHGKRASDEIAKKLDQAEALLKHNITLDGTADGSKVLESKVEGIAAEFEETGIKARFAWLVLEVQVTA